MANAETPIASSDTKNGTALEPAGLKAAPRDGVLFGVGTETRGGHGGRIRFCRGIRKRRYCLAPYQ